MNIESFEAERPTRAPHFPQRGRILIVDDDPVLRAMVSAILIDQSWEVMNASSAEEAAELLKYCAWHQKKVDVVILDLILPGGMSGMEALPVLVGIQLNLRFVASSGFFAGEDSWASCLCLGFHDILPKPYTATALTEVIRRTVERISTTADKAGATTPAGLRAA